MAAQLVKGPTATRVRILGRVQAVFFRGWVVETARALGVAGWVRNCADGSVEAHFEGPEDTIEAMVARCHEGPPMARVDHIEPDPVEPEGCTGFHELPTTTRL